MNWELIFKLAIGVLGIGTAIIVGINQVRAYKHKRAEQLAQDKGLSANPTRCLQHEERMGKNESIVSGVVGTMTARFDGMSKQLDGVATDVRTLINLHLKE
jgi:fumarate hydratase class II